MMHGQTQIKLKIILKLIAEGNIFMPGDEVGQNSEDCYLTKNF